jgi:thiol-disulfide isomerase/thioredoxin
MRILSRPLSFLLLPLAAVGCNSVGAGRTGLMPQIQTLVRVGDKPLPVVAGTPGDQVATALEPLPRRRLRPEGRVSGRVVDARGDPVPNAHVRLAVTGALGGKLISATTDASGGFTLHGLRPGASYTLIAESDSPQGPLVGRGDVQAPASEVEICLRAADNGADHPLNRASARISPASNRSESAEPEQPQHRLNEEDLPPVPEADELVSSARDQPRRPVPQLAAPLQSSRWRRGGSVSETAAAPADPLANKSSVLKSSETSEAPPTAPARDRPLSAVATAPAQASDPDEDIPNPLPPALEPDQNPAAAPVTPTPAPALAPAEGAPSPADPPASASPAPEPDWPASNPSALAPPPPTRTPASGSDPAPDLLAALAAPPGPTPSATPPVAPVPTPWPPRAAQPSALRPQPSALSATESAPAPPGPSASSPAKRPTWGDLALQAPGAPAHEPPPVAAPAATWGQIAPSASTNPLPPAFQPAARTRFIAHAKVPKATAPFKAYCTYNPLQRRIIDFQLPDLQGQPVRLKDLDSDLVLIDFWGTWCSHCAKSIPHLVQLQRQLGPKRLTVIGIAYEEGPVAEQVANVRESAAKLGINYPILLGGLDGPCPLQDALHVQVFPTMVLLDRDGRILWRDQGATPTTLARLDRVLASRVRADDVVRR